MLFLSRINHETEPVVVYFVLPTLVSSVEVSSRRLGTQVSIKSWRENCIIQEVY